MDNNKDANTIEAAPGLINSTIENIKEERELSTITLPENSSKTNNNNSNISSIFYMDKKDNDNIPTDIRPRDLLPDFRTFGHNASIKTELGTSDAQDIMHAIEQAQFKHVSLKSSTTKTTAKEGHEEEEASKDIDKDSSLSQQRIPSWYRIGWTSFSSKTNPGGILPMLATEKNIKEDSEEQEENIFEALFYIEWLRQTGGIVFIGILSWGLATYGGGAVTFIVLCFFLITYTHMKTKRFELYVRDDIKRDLVTLQFEEAPEPAEWLNSFFKNFWIIFEPVLSAYIIENIDTYLVDYLPGFLDSVRLTTFTLGNKPFQIENVKTLSSEDNVVCMDWYVTFEPNDTTGMSKKELKERKSPRVELQIRLGKGFVGAAIPVLVENMSFSGHLRVKLEFISQYPYIRLVEACFMKNPEFDYVLKPIGGDTFGFDVNNLPGLQSFVRDQVHAILGPMMYYPNVFSFDIEKFFSGELDISQANGVLAVTTYGTSTLNASDIPGGNTNLFIRFYLDKAQELGRTGTRQGTLEPNWNETHFLLLNNLNSKLTLEMRNDSGNAFKDHRIARAHYDLSELAEDDDFAVEGLDIDLLRKGKRITTLKADMRYLPVSKPTTLEDGTIEPAAESNSGVLRFTINECRNLKSDRVSPYAIIMVNGVEKVKTPVFKRTSNPKFERSGEVVVLDRTAVFLRVDLYDSIDFAEDALLGTWTSYLIPVMKEQSKNNNWWDLTVGNKNTGRIRVSVQWKPVIMSGLIRGPIGPNAYRPPIGMIRLSLWEARDLRNVEAVTGGKSDPYVRIMSGSQIRARTQVIDNNLFPEWGEFHYVPIHSMHEDLVLEVMDWNAKTKDKLLGSTKLRIRDLVKQLSSKDKDDPTKWYEQLQKIDKWVPLQSPKMKGTKGELRYTAEFYPTVALKEEDEENNQSNDDNNKESKIVTNNNNNNKQSELENEKSVDPIETENLPNTTNNNNKDDTTDTDGYVDLHGLPIKRTPDGLIDITAYNSGIIKIHIHEVQFSNKVNAYCAVMVDSLYSQFRTSSIKGKTLLFNEASDAFVKEADFSRINIDIKPMDSDEKDEDKYGYWATSVIDIIRHIQQKQRTDLTNKKQQQQQQQQQIKKNNDDNNNDDDNKNEKDEQDNDQGEWFDLFGTTDGPGRIRLSFDYIPIVNFTLNPDESLENQGNLTVTLLDAKDLLAADKSGTSDPYVIFTVNGERVLKSPVVKKTVNPVWKDVQFTQQIISRVNASFRIEVFDWNQFSGDIPLGSGGISLRNEYVESFAARIVEIPLDGIKGVTGYVRVRFLWQPQLLTTRKTHTSFLTTMRTMTSRTKTSTGGTTAFDFGKPLPSNTSSAPLRSSSLVRPPPTSSKSKEIQEIQEPSVNQQQQQPEKSKSTTSVSSTSLQQQQPENSIRSSTSSSYSLQQQIDQQKTNDTDINSETSLRGRVVVNIVGARKLMAADKNGLSDPYVHVRLNHHTLHKTKHIKKTLEPEWNESFHFELTNPKITVLEYIVKDYNRFSSSVELGTYQQDYNTFKDLIAAKTLSQRLPLTPQGELVIRMDFLPH